MTSRAIIAVIGATGAQGGGLVRAIFNDPALAITLPMGDARLPAIAAEDIGKCALGVFKKGESLIGKTVGIAGDHLTGGEMAAAFSRALGREVKYNAVDPAVYRGFDFPGAEDLGNMFQFNRDFSDAFCGARSLAGSRENCEETRVKIVFRSILFMGGLRRKPCSTDFGKRPPCLIFEPFAMIPKPRAANGLPAGWTWMWTRCWRWMTAAGP